VSAGGRGAVAAGAGAAVARRGGDAALEVDLDVVPVGEAGLGLAGDGLVGRAEVLHRAVGEDDAPAERVAAGVLLVDGDVPVGAALLEEAGEEEAGGASADAG